MARLIVQYYERPDVPWCVLGKMSWGVVTAVKVPEYKAAEYVAKYGFSVLIKDTDFPVPIDNVGTMPEITSTQSNPARRVHAHRYRVDADFWREEGA